MAFAIELLNITKGFPGVIANNDVSVHIKEGEIHGLLGENGAGKSTIMNILYGMSKPDEGKICLFGQAVEFQSPMDAIRQGIGMVHQHFMLMPDETVLRNIILGWTPKKGICIDEKRAVAEINDIMEQYGLKVNLKAKINQISVGEKQRVEIIKALYRKVKILILDEPTAVLTPAETDSLLDIMRRLKEQGCTLIFITHKLREVMDVTDNVTVMRKGVVTGFGPTSEMDITKLSRLIVGKEVSTKIPMEKFHPGDKKVLEMKHVSTARRPGRMPLKDVSLVINEGEIVGVAGVDGNGQTDLGEVIAGLIPAESGAVFLDEKDVTRDSIRKRRKKGLSHVPEDRLKTGAARDCTISENLMLNMYNEKPYSNKSVMNQKEVLQTSEELCEKYLVKTPDSNYTIGTLSGGNMQKVVVAREFSSSPRLLIAAQPTRGVDIGATQYIRTKIAELRDSGKGILLISAELEEVMAMSDKIVVIYEGEIVAQFKRGEADEYEIGEYMLGSKRQEVLYGN
ncbi:MAG: ABC transporter ATP-binding protein [Hespellia sp.]|nr:ABC transporter ATP-binding protein [Hespellia sp.]